METTTSSSTGSPGPLTEPASQSKAAAPFGKRTIMQRIRHNWQLYLLLIPLFLLLAIFIYYPAFLALLGSLYDWVPGVKTDYVGLLNFRRIFNDRLFWTGFRNVAVVAIWHFTVPFVMPFLVAELIYSLRSRRAQSFYRIAILVPILVPGLVNLQLWKWLYSFPDGGVNLLLRTLGLGGLARPWLGTAQTALPAILFMGFPWIIGITPLIYLAGLMNIPMEIIDAAKIDGCGPLRRIISIHVPFLIGQFRLFFILGIIGVLQEYGQFLILTGGGPYGQTMVPGLYLYIKAFGLTREEQQITNMGQAAAVGVILFVLILSLSLLARRARFAGIDDD